MNIHFVNNKTKFIAMALSLYFFFVSIKLMGISLGIFSDDMASSIIETATNPFIALFIGILSTTLLQSSSASTSIMVGLVAAGIIDLTTVIPMIMGANIGTTVTNIIASLAHLPTRAEFGKAFSAAVVHDFFNVLTVLVLFPIEMTFHIIENTAIFCAELFVGLGGITFVSPVSIIVKPSANYLASLLGMDALTILVASLFIFFASLTAMVTIMKTLVVEKSKKILDSHFFKNDTTAFFTGTGITMLVQSSSISTSLMVPLVGTGMIKLRKAFPYMIGSNLGTTITAIMAALVIGTPLALSVAFAHSIFNFFGMLIFMPLREIPIRLAEMFGELARKYRRVAIGYLITAFYIIPAILVFFVR